MITPTLDDDDVEEAMLAPGARVSTADALKALMEVFDALTLELEREPPRSRTKRNRMNTKARVSSPSTPADRLASK